MEAKELMIGNYVKDPYNTEIRLVSVEKSAGQLRPIPLTEEWLIKFGFYRKNFAWVLCEPSSNMTKFEFSIWEDLTYNTAELRPPIDFVHQLQNLYFALTGEELSIK